MRWHIGALLLAKLFLDFIELAQAVVTVLLLVLLLVGVHRKDVLAQRVVTNLNRVCLALGTQDLAVVVSTADVFRWHCVALFEGFRYMIQLLHLL